MGPGLYNYWMVIVLMMTGLYVVLARPNLVKKIMGVTIFQMSVIMLYITLGKVAGGTAPILIEGAEDVAYSNPVPHVLMLTAIVVGIATTALGLALAIRVYEEFGTLEDDEIRDAEIADAMAAEAGGAD
ncbi:MAG: cation:proton antiporter subunit C [Thermoanaerobaculia bacterium]|nr:cation:proton antiporter subunit C [Thermoanaerobaculia bacterium]